MTQALIMIDVQNEYFPGGKLELVGMEYATYNCQRLLEHFRGANLPIFHVQHIADQENAAVFTPKTKGIEIHEIVSPKENEVLIAKHYPNSFRETTLQNELQTAKITELIVCGAMTHMCVDSTVRAAFDLGYACKVIADACATRDLEFRGGVVKAADVHIAFMASLQPTFATILATQDFLNQP